MLRRLCIGLSLLVLLLSEVSSWGWGRRGHSIVCQSAAYLAAKESKGAFLRDHSFDLGYYCNVPDIAWKKPETVKRESLNHYMDMEIFDRAFRGSKIKDPFELDRVTFNKTFPMIPDRAGRAFWRIREIGDLMRGDHDQLMKKDLKHDSRFALQGMWLIHAGIMGHYVGDLGMPMHLSENHDGQITHQQGLHWFFEDEVVNELFHGSDDSELETSVYMAAEKRWKKDRTILAKLSVLAMIERLGNESFRQMPEMLKIDRQVGRDLKKAAPAYKKMIVARMASASVTLAELYRRGLGFDFDDNRFYFFAQPPRYIEAPK